MLLKIDGLSIPAFWLARGMHSKTPSFIRTWTTRLVTGRQQNWMQTISSVLGLNASAGSPISRSRTSAVHSSGMPEGHDMGMRDLDNHSSSHTPHWV